MPRGGVIACHSKDHAMSSPELHDALVCVMLRSQHSQYYHPMGEVLTRGLLTTRALFCPNCACMSGIGLNSESNL